LKLVFIVVVGILGSLAMFFISWEREKTQVESHFVRMASGQTALVQRILENNLFFLESVAQFYENSNRVERQEFRSFVMSLLPHTRGVQAMAWAPRVRSAERNRYEQIAREEGLAEFEFFEKSADGKRVSANLRDEYFPIYYAEPFDRNAGAMGYDLISEEIRRNALFLARDTGQAIATRPVILVYSHIGQKGFLVVRPLYRNDIVPKTMEDRRDSLEGFIVGVFQLEVIFQEAISHLSHHGIDMSVESLSKNPREHFYYYHPSGLDKALSIQTVESKTCKSDSLTYKETIEVAGRTWQISCCMANAQAVEYWEPWGFLAMGFGTCSLIAFFYGALLRRMLKNRRQAEVLRYTMNQLRNVHAKDKTLLDAISAIFIALDEHDHVIQWNAAAEDCFGISAAEAVGKSLNDLAVPWNHNVIMQAIEASRTNNHTARIDDVPFIRRDGQQGFLGITVSAIDMGSDTRGGCILLGRDITTQRQELEKIRELQLQIEFILGASKTRLDIIDAEFNLRYVDSEWQKMYGPYEGRKCFAYFMGRDEACPNCGVLQAFQTKQAIVSEEILVKEGNRPVQVTTIPFQAANGEWLVAEVNVDITERKQAEEMRERILDRQKRLNQIQENLLGPDTLERKLKVITDSVIDIVSADFCRIWLTGSGDLCEKGCIHAGIAEGPHTCQNRKKCLHLVSSSGRYTHIDSPNHRRVPLGNYKIGRIAADLERKFLTNDVPHDPWIHNPTWAEELGLASFAGYQLCPPGGETIGVLALFSKNPLSPEDDALLENLSNTVAHVIQLAKVNEALQESEEKYRSIFETAANLILTVNPDGQIIQCNQRVYTLLGYQPRELVGRFLEQIFVAEDYSRFLEAFETVIAQGSLYDQEYRMIRNGSSGEGSFVEVSINSTLYVDKQENCLRIICIVHDITQQKMMHRQLLQAQKLESIGQLAAGIAHEINTPTQYIGDNIRFLEEGFSEIVSLLKACNSLREKSAIQKHCDQTLDDLASRTKEMDIGFLIQEIPQAIQHSLEGVKTVAEIVKAMKEFSHPGEKEKKMLDINNAIQSTLTISRNYWKYVADVQTYLEPDLPLVECYPAEINQVLLNIIANAADSISGVIDRSKNEKGLIVITTDKTDEKYLEVRISDTGGGIPKDIQDKVFNPFFTTKTVGKGTGQGLSISHAIISRHQGTITFESEDGIGTTFIIQLPLMENES